MQKTLLAATMLLLAACNSQSSQQPSSDEPKDNRFDELLAQYEDIKFDTLPVFSVSDINNKPFKFTGKPLDSAAQELLPANLRNGNTTGGPGFYACFKFNMDKEHIGLVTRTPSMYVASSIKLLIYNSAKDSITQYTELAELWGDAGDVYDKKSWLYKDAGAQWRNLILVKETHDNSIENPANKTTSVRNAYYQLAITGSRIDTLSNDSTKLAREFSRIRQ